MEYKIEIENRDNKIKKFALFNAICNCSAENNGVADGVNLEALYKSTNETKYKIINYSNILKQILEQPTLMKFCSSTNNKQLSFFIRNFTPVSLQFSKSEILLDRYFGIRLELKPLQTFEIILEKKGMPVVKYTLSGQNINNTPKK